ncbi:MULTISPECIES: DUF1206 domain-containing protein [Actinomadura]|uniref:DUF1206 domain-containing protein n=1 Tax=Actinomadura yumaensis TaxID=111807 RepID=A0ABW2CC84_9ACTN|nr:DUF1206 domain-containing protein [Actinomadura sp. J1-007]MWK33481.1 DUF1206 domain-containing protein [Actinomadura sp. J1-007]
MQNVMGRKAAGHPWFHRLSRGGLVARGVLYLLVGWLAVRIGLGDGGGKEADRGGALQTVADNPGGSFVLWLLAAGFVGLALWQFSEARYGRPLPDGDSAFNRLTSLARGVVYLAGFAATVAFLLGHGGTSSDQQSKTYTARAMAEPGGRWLVLAVGAGFVVWGVVSLVNAARRAFLDELKTGQMNDEVRRRIVVPLGVAGNAARGLVGGAVGVFLAYSAITFDAGQAKGLDGTLREFAGTPAGRWGLVAVAVGLLLFGLYSFCEARWRKVEAVPDTRA